MAEARNSRSAQQGFTLIEVMVALAVFGLAALALLRLESQTIRSTDILDQTLMAQMVARNVAIDAVTDPGVPTVGLATGSEQNGGRNWNWTRTISRLGGGDIYKVDVTVADSQRRMASHLTMVRPPAVAVQMPAPVSAGPTS